MPPTNCETLWRFETGGFFAGQVVSTILTTNLNMAKVLAESGRYVSQQAVKKLRSIWKIVLLTTSAMAAVWGFAEP